MKHTPTKQAAALIEALRKRGVDLIPEYDDGHKTVDIYIPKAGLFIEINGLQHYTNPEKIIADLKRSHFSDGDDKNTMPITNQLIETHLDEIADAIAQVVKEK